MASPLALTGAMNDPSGMTAVRRGDGSGMSSGSLADSLARIEQRLARLEAGVARVEEGAAGAPAALAAVVDTLDDTAASLQGRGVDIDARLAEALRLLERLSSPEVTKSLASALELTEKLPGTVAMAADTMDDVADGLRARGVDVDDRITTLLQVMDRLTQPAALAAVSSMLDKVEQVRYLLESGVFDPAAVRVVAELGQSLAMSGARTPPKIGAFGALRAMSDPDVQRALGFTLSLARSFGASLRDLEDVERKALTQGNAQ